MDEEASPKKTVTASQSKTGNEPTVKDPKNMTAAERKALMVKAPDVKPSTKSEGTTAAERKAAMAKKPT